MTKAKRLLKIRVLHISLLKYIFLIFIFLILFIRIGDALTASIGNSRMILYVEPGQTIEKYILVSNVNDVSVNVNLTASGPLLNNIAIKDKSFELKPKEEKKAYFTITAKEKGTTENHINIQFKSGKSGVGLISTIIVVTGDNLPPDEEDNGENNQNTNNNTSSDNSSQNQNNQQQNSQQESDKESNSNSNSNRIYVLPVNSDGSSLPLTKNLDIPSTISIDEDKSSESPITFRNNIIKKETLDKKPVLSLLFVSAILLILLLAMLFKYSTKKIRKNRVKERNV